MNDALRQIIRDTVQVGLGVLVVASLLFAATGVWPPMVAVESGSMEPHMERGDLVVVADPTRDGPETVAGVVTAAEAPPGSRTIGAPGDVIVFDSPYRPGSPIIHRAHLYVEAGENWYDDADPAHLPAGVDSCRELEACPAPHAGFVTKGDANSQYDQVNGNAPVVRPDSIRAEAHVRIPYLGYVRLTLTGA
ncbi:S26 family signal peptidase [Halobaculum limi]|uniref:S26 family signal peptidase n=1 Tax=Halobaculum limi TaxID=3031916 RepID=UPI002406BF74|nr:S26 family signal peptidase [Halobaculum sp. YSMS11]